MRVAIAGKGGAGKTTITATLARLLARDHRPVVTVDADSNPNLAAALGVPPEQGAQPDVLPVSLVSRRLDGPALKEDIESVLAHHALQAPDGVNLLHMGMPTHADEGCLCAGHATVSALLGDLGQRPDYVTLVDLEASPEHLSRGTAKNVDVLLFVTEPYYRSLETVRRMAELAAELPISQVGVVANKVRKQADADAIEAFCERHGLELLATVPYSDAVIDADVAQVPLIDSATEGDAVAAVAGLASRLAGEPVGS